MKPVATASPITNGSQPTNCTPTGQSSGSVCIRSLVAGLFRTSISAEIISRNAKDIPWRRATNRNGRSVQFAIGDCTTFGSSNPFNRIMPR